MVSAQISGTEIQIGFWEPDGRWEPVKTGSVNEFGSGGSSQGIIATAYSTNASYHQMREGKVAYPGCQWGVLFKLKTASAVDKSDCAIRIPFTVMNTRTGKTSTRVLQNTTTVCDFGTATDIVSGDYGSFVPLADKTGATGVASKVGVGEEMQLGTIPGTWLFASIEDGA